MNIIVREYNETDISAMIEIWNEVVEDGIAFPQEETLSYESGKAFFEAQTYCAVAVDMNDNKIYGLY
ncbi:MAG: GNAT family N-acetyltransferase, partial [Eubacterium sp.]|nr:GNAT family N-acetyltransferase [Eubacterium sp.]